MGICVEVLLQLEDILDSPWVRKLPCFASLPLQTLTPVWLYIKPHQLTTGNQDSKEPTASTDVMISA